MKTGTPRSGTVTRGYTVALVSAAILSTTALFIGYLSAVYSMPPLVLAFWREAFVFICLSAVLFLVRPALLRVRREDLPFLAGYGFVLAVFNALWTVSVQMNGAGVSTVLVYTSAAFTAVLGRVFLSERLGAGKAAAILVAVVGCALVSRITPRDIGSANLAGVGIGLVSGLSYALYTMVGRAAALRGMNSWSTLRVIFGCAALFMAAFVLLFPSESTAGLSAGEKFFWLGARTDGWMVLFLLAAVPTLAGYGLYNKSLDFLPSATANLIATSEPAFTVVLAYFTLGERLSLSQAAGSVLLLGAVAAIRFTGAEKKKPVEPAA